MKYALIAGLAFLSLTTTAFAQTTTINNDADTDDTTISGLNNDPYQDFNRHMYAFNDGIDKVLFKPLAMIYQDITPAPVRTGVTNFFNNIDTVPTIFNDALQGNSYYVGRDSWRLIINSTVGVGGLFDVAKHMGLPQHKEDFGLTLTKWGYSQSDFIVLPIFGPSTIRDSFGIPVFFLTSPTTYAGTNSVTAWGLYGLQAISIRSNLLNYDNALDQVFDPYTSVKNAYLQRRSDMIAKNQSDPATSSSSDTDTNTSVDKYNTSSLSSINSSNS